MAVPKYPRIDIFLAVPRYPRIDLSSYSIDTQGAGHAVPIHQFIMFSPFVSVPPLTLYALITPPCLQCTHFGFTPLYFNRLVDLPSSPYQQLPLYQMDTQGVVDSVHSGRST